MQKGLSLIIVLFALVIIAGLVYGGYFYFQQQKIKQINSFEECGKYYPVMESYPAQCNTPDGRHFVQELSEEEKKKLNPLSSDKIDNWKTYTNNEVNYSIKYPPSLNQSVSSSNNPLVDSWVEKNSSYAIYIYTYKDDEIVQSSSNLEFNAELKSEEEIMINGQSVKKLTGREKGTLIHIGPFKNSGKSYFIVYTSGNNIAEENSLRTFDQMLSTFKFIQLISQECGVCGSEGMHNLEGRQCAQGLECKNQSQGVASSVYFCVKPGKSIENCLER